jgi:hypothetical protein
MKKRVLFLVGFITVMFVALAALVSVTNAPAASRVEVQSCLSIETGCLRFPMITGTTLSGKNLAMPDDFGGQYNLVIVPFDRDQQVKADTWLPIARELAQQNPELRYYSVAIFPDMAAPMRALARGGMNVVIPTDLHDITITAFLEDRQAFLDALAIPNTERIQAFLLNGDGEVLWRGSGDYTQAQGDRLRLVAQSSGG